MLVPSPNFLVFSLLAIILYNASRNHLWRQIILLAFNLSFLASFLSTTLGVIPFAGFIVLGFGALAVARLDISRAVFALLICLVLAVFAWLKHYNIFPTGAFLPFSYLTIGLSYILLRVLHLVIDARQDNAATKLSFLQYVNYTTDFTCIVSGPFQRYESFASRYGEAQPIDLSGIGTAVERIIKGYFKVAVLGAVVLAVHGEQLASIALDQPLTTRAMTGTIAIASYPIYLFLNFSGYTDVVIGIARLLGNELPENFDRPFSSENYIQFWGRWHMSLSNWLKTYVYNPFLMAAIKHIQSPRSQALAAVPAFFLTFFLVGIWHGQTLGFLFFGFLQGLGVAANKLYQIEASRLLGRSRYRSLASNALYSAVARGLTFTWFAFSMIWFWASWSDARNLLGELGGPAILLIGTALLAAGTIILALIVSARKLLHGLALSGPKFDLSRYARTSLCTAEIFLTLAVLVLSDMPAPDIVYKTF